MNETGGDRPQDSGQADRPASGAAQRALAEAAARRLEMDSRPAPAGEIGGRDGPDPARYGDWEKKGIAIDF